MWNNGVFEVAHASGVGRRVRAIEGNVDKGNGARRLKQGCREKGSLVRQRTRLGGKDEKDKKRVAVSCYEFQIVGLERSKRGLRGRPTAPLDTLEGRARKAWSAIY